MNYLNKALDSFSSNLVNPVHYIFFTVFVILASSILFQEWRRIAFVDIFATIIGLTIVIIALFLISAFNDSQITLLELYSSSSRKILK
jgi:threonine/homoserine/homoserine lactone efflux protein